MKMKTDIYRVKDNGHRSFIPPCFCWDLISISTNEKTVVSEIDLTRLNLTPEEMTFEYGRLAKGERLVKGFISTVPTVGGYSPGKRLTVIEFINSEREI
jgi:hypothetical protein